MWLRVFLLAMAAIAASPFAGADVPQQLLRDAKKAVARDLFDPESARFRDVRLHDGRPMGTFVVCGEVNAKNRYGGYVGFVPFFWVNDGNPPMVASHAERNPTQTLSPTYLRNVQKIICAGDLILKDAAPPG